MKKIKDLTWLIAVHAMFVLALIVDHESLVDAYNYDLTFEQSNMGMSLREWFIQDCAKHTVCK